MESYRYFIRKIRSTNFSGGIPRKCFLVQDANTESMLGIYEEGFLGEDAIPEDIKKEEVFWLEELNLNPSDYDKFISEYEEYIRR